MTFILSPYLSNKYLEKTPLQFELMDSANFHLIL